MKFAKIIAVIIVIFLIVFFAFEHIVLVAIAKNGIKRVVDLKTHMSKIAVQPLKGILTVKGMEIYNPPGYQIRSIAEISRVLLDFKIETFFEPGAFFDKIEVNIEKINIIKNKDGVVNLSKMSALTPRENGSPPPFRVDKYHIKIGKIYYTDRTREEKDQVREIELGVDEEYKNLKDPGNLAKIIAYKVFFNGKIGNIGVDIKKIRKDLAALAEKNKRLKEEFTSLDSAGDAPLKKGLSEKVEAVKSAIKEEAAKTGEAIAGKVEKVGAAAGKAMDALSVKEEDAGKASGEVINDGETGGASETAAGPDGKTAGDQGGEI